MRVTDRLFLGREGCYKESNTADRGLAVAIAGCRRLRNTMAVLAPPPSPPCAALDDNDDGQRFRMRVVQGTTTVITVLGTAWVCTLGVIPAIIALMTAKHILVAVLLVGLKVDWPTPGGKT